MVDSNQPSHWSQKALASVWNLGIMIVPCGGVVWMSGISPVSLDARLVFLMIFGLVHLLPHLWQGKCYGMRLMALIYDKTPTWPQLLVYTVLYTLSAATLLF